MLSLSDTVRIQFEWMAAKLKIQRLSEESDESFYDRVNLGMIKQDIEHSARIRDLFSLPIYTGNMILSNVRLPENYL